MAEEDGIKTKECSWYLKHIVLSPVRCEIA